MRKLMLVATALVAFAATGIAVAKGVEGTRTAKAVAGTFTATTASNTDSKSCTTSDNKTIVRARGTYAGTAAGYADLAGAITLDVSSTINTTDDVGVVEGKVKGANAQARFSAVYDHGKLAGLATGHSKDTELLANLSAGFTAAGGFTDGKLGGGTAGGGAVLLGPGKCAKEERESSEARGTISAVSATSITVGGLTCTVPASFATQIAELKVGDKAEIRCTLAGGTNTLAKVSKKK